MRRVARILSHLVQRLKAIITRKREREIREMSIRAEKALDDIERGLRLLEAGYIDEALVLISRGYGSLKEIEDRLIAMLKKVTTVIDVETRRTLEMLERLLEAATRGELKKRKARIGERILSPR